MKNLIRNLFGLAAPAIALPTDDPDMAIGQAVERVSAVSEGAELIDFLRQSNYDLDIFGPTDDHVRRAQAMCHPLHRKIYFHESSTLDQMAAYLPHEAFHALQFDQVPALVNFMGSVVTDTVTPSIYFDKSDVVELIHPDDMLYAYNLLEMGAFAMQSHVISKMADAGDIAVHNSQIRANNSCLMLYESIMDTAGVASLTIGDRTIFNSGAVNVLPKYGHRKVATAVTAYAWFWNAGHREEDGTESYDRLTYNAGKAELTLKSVFNKRAPYFAMKEDGYRFDFRPLERSEISLLGTGCGQQMFDIAEFDDITDAAYRTAMTPESRNTIDAINRELGLKLV
jgi:hypothetical protein